MRIYFDTEFSSLWDPQPISVGFVTAEGEGLYIELIHDTERNSDFVNKTVIPLLESEHKTHPEAAARSIRSFLNRHKTVGHDGNNLPTLICDFIGDFWILKGLIPDIEDYVIPRCARHSHTAPVFLANPKLRQHHALDDAWALCILNPTLQVE